MSEEEDYDDGSNDFNTDSIQTMGILNALKTGNVHVDMLVAMCIPIVLRLVFSTTNKVMREFSWHDIQEYFFPSNVGMIYHRSIVFRGIRSYWGGLNSIDEDSENSILIKAVKMYLHKCCHFSHSTAKFDLTSMEDESAWYGGSNDYSDSEDDEDDTNSSSNRKTLYGYLSRYNVVEKPPTGVLINLGNYPGTESVNSSINNNNNKIDVDEVKKVGEVEPNDINRVSHPVNLMIREREEFEKDDKVVTITFDFSSPGPTSIHTFLNKAYTWYKNELRKMNDTSRYLYEMKTPGSEKDHTNATYARYKLSDDKTFDSLFFKDKESLLNIVKHFTEKTGKYAIRGYPHKLGLLLHGPPGTGKTSLIKSLAQYTGRSIINVPLAKITTNSQLMSIFFDRKFEVAGSEFPAKLSYKDIIFVMEDVDAASSVVHRRDGKQTADVTRTVQVQYSQPKSIWHMLLESTSSDCKDLVKDLIEKSPRLKEEATKLPVFESVAQKITMIPGLGLVGDVRGRNNEGLSEIGSDAVSEAETVMERMETVEKYVCKHASVLKSLLDNGRQVDDDLVQVLLGAFPSGETIEVNPSKQMPKIPKKHVPSKNVSYSKYTDSDGVHVNTDSSSSNSNNSTTAGNAIMPIERTATTTATTTATGTKTMDGQNNKQGSNQTTLSPYASTGVGPTKTVIKDALNLSGLLNVLDGVVDTPGRIVIMTTNHPEKLDPALIRPGRIDKKLLLGYMRGEDVISMMEHYFQLSSPKLDIVQRGRILDSIRGNPMTSRSQLELTPAQVEQLTAEHEDVEDMICALEKMGETNLGQSSSVLEGSVSTIRYDV